MATTVAPPSQPEQAAVPGSVMATTVAPLAGSSSDAGDGAGPAAGVMATTVAPPAAGRREPPGLEGLWKRHCEIFQQVPKDGRPEVREGDFLVYGCHIDRITNTEGMGVS